MLRNYLETLTPYVPLSRTAGEGEEDESGGIPQTPAEGALPPLHSPIGQF